MVAWIDFPDQDAARLPRGQVIEVFARGSDGVIRETWYNWGNGQWGDWIRIGGSAFGSDPQTVGTADGHEQVFAISNGGLHENWFDPGSGAVGGWAGI